MKQIPYSNQWISEDDIEAVVDALNSKYITQGPRVKELEEKVARYCGAKYAIAVNSGTSALHAACFAAGIGPQDEVITSPITFVASANCILYCSAKPVFADVQKDSINIEPKEVEDKITSRTKAIIPVHFAGHPCDLEKINDIAKKNKLIVIEDAAHALGAEYKDSKIGSCKYSDMTVLSFHAVKHLTTGEGGMILTNNENYYQKLLMFRTHGITRDSSKLFNKDEGDWYYEMQMLGFNYRITDFQCALGIKQLERLDQFIARRREIIEKYNEAFAMLEGFDVPREKEGLKSAWHIYSIQVNYNRKRVYENLRKAGIEVNVHYLPVYLHPYFQKIGFKKGLCPKAELYYSRAITLPLFPKMTDEDINYVIQKVREVIKSHIK